MATKKFVLMTSFYLEFELEGDPLGEYHPERCDGYIARAQDELRHGRRPEWLDTEAHNG